MALVLLGDEDKCGEELLEGQRDLRAALEDEVDTLARQLWHAGVGRQLVDALLEARVDKNFVELVRLQMRCVQTIAMLSVVDEEVLHFLADDRESHRLGRAVLTA